MTSCPPEASSVAVTSNVGTLRGSHPLHKQYAVECVPQHAHMDVRRDGYVHFAHTLLGENNSAPADVFHGVVRRIGLPNNLTAKQYREFYAQVSEDLSTLVSGMGSRWNGRDFVGTLTSEAEQALADIRQAAGELQGEYY